MKRLSIIFRRARTLLWTAFSILVILAAVLVGAGKLLMPYSDRYQPRLEAWLSREFGQPVVIDSFEGDWTAFGPRLTLQGMRLLPPEAGVEDGVEDGEAAEVVIESAALDIRPLNALVPGLPHYNFRVTGADFELLHAADGEFRLSGFGVSRRGPSSGGSALKELARVGEVVVENASLKYLDERHGVELDFREVEGRLHLEGDEFSTEIRAQLFDERAELVYGEIDATLRLQLDGEERIESASWQASAGDFMLAAFQGRLPANPFLPLTGWFNAELWGDWSRAEGHLIRGSSRLHDAWLVNEHQDLTLSQVEALFRWRYRESGRWELHFSDLLFDDGEKEWTAPRVSIARNLAEDLGLWISADELPLDVPLNLARDVMSIYGTAWPHFLPRSASGQVRELELGLSGRWRLRFARGGLVDASVSDWDRWPDLQGLDGRVVLDAESGRISLSGDRVRMDWPRWFREPIELALPGCKLDLGLGPQWQLAFSDCSLENEDIAAAADIVIRANGGKPAIDVNATVFRGRVGHLQPYWPEAIMKDNIKTWLRRGLLGGDIVSGRLQIRGDMDDWPFRNGEGRFEAVARVENGSIDYLEGWPRAEGVAVTARFLGPGMDIRGSVGNIGGLSSHRVGVSIADMKTALLEVEFEAEDTIPGFLRFLRGSPLQEQIQVDLDQFTFSGPAATRGSIRVPLGDTPGELEVAGQVDISGGLFSDPASEVTLSRINGRLDYDQRGFSGEGLSAEFRGAPARLALQADADSEEKFRADMSGRFPVADVIPAFLLEDFLALRQVGGECLWQVALRVGPGPDGGDTRTVLRIDSDLEGVAMDLPAPMNKLPSERWPFFMNFRLDGERRPLDVVFEGRSVLRFELDGETGSPVNSVLRLGEGLPAPPPDGFIRLEGRSPYVDLDGWIDIIVEEATSGTGVAGLALEDGELSAGRILFLDRFFDDVNMLFGMDGDDVRAEFAAQDIEGKLRFTLSESGTNSLAAEFERLVLGDPISGGVGMESDPSELPALHLYARSFSYAGVEMGETRIEAYPTASGFHFEKVEAASDALSVNASGDWSLDGGQHRSEFAIHMASESLGDFLNSMDISSSVQGGQTLVDFDAWWAGSPAAFALSRLNGQIEFSVVNGNITNASAGTGRLLGLLSIQALPRRLSLDFRDVFDSGFSFDEATGSFEMENGTAFTDDILLKSSAANIMVSGKTDLVQQRYDQLLTIRPGLGNTLPLIGALAAGPGGAAAGLALQGLLHKPLAEATQVQYTITGDWDDPTFEAVDVRRVEPEPQQGVQDSTDTGAK